MTVQKGKNIIYDDHFILGQIIAAASCPDGTKNYECAENEVKIVFGAISRLEKFCDLEKASLLSMFTEMKRKLVSLKSCILLQRG